MSLLLGSVLVLWSLGLDPPAGSAAPGGSGASAAPVADWPQWRGPSRDGVSRETGLLEKWPEKGPTLLWEARGIGDGFSTVAVAGGRVYTQGAKEGKNWVFALNYATGKDVWAAQNGHGYENSYGDGPRSTPTVDGDVLYALNAEGDLVCLELSAGKARWSLNILTKFGASNIGWGLSESPLVAGNRLIVTPGGKDATLVALDPRTGETLWTSKGLSDRAAYSSAITFEAAGAQQVVTLTHSGMVGVALDDGRFLWRHDRAVNGIANIATVLYHDGAVFATTDYDTGCALIRLKAGDAKKVMAEEVYFSRDLQNHHGGVVLVGEHLYGFSGNGTGLLTCMEWKTGKVAWRDRSVGKGSVVYADGHLYVLSQDGLVGLVEASPDGYREKGRFQIEHGKQPAWAHPVVAGGRLFLRTQDTLRAYEVH